MAAKKRAKSNRPSGDGNLVHLSIAIGIGSVGLLVAFALVWWQIMVQPHQLQLEEVKQQMLQHYAGFFNGRIDDLRTQVSAMASAPAANSAIETYDAARLAQIGERLALEHPKILRVAVIQKGKAQVDLNAEVPISFAALDLIRRAESKAFVGPEVSLNQRNLIYAAQPITPQGVVAGVLLVVYSSDYFLGPLKQYDGTSSSLKVEQKFEGNPRTVVMQWGATEGEGESYSTQLLAPHWTLSFSAQNNILPPAATIFDLAMPFGVAWIVMMGGIFLSFSRQARLLKEDAAQLSEYASRILRGRPARRATYHLAPMREVAIALSQFGAEPVQAKDGEADDDPDDLLSDLDEPEESKPKKANKGADDFLEVRRAIQDDNFGIEVNEESGGPDVDIDPGIFRAYDIRGITTTNLTPEVVYWIGRAFAAQAKDLEQDRVVVGRDGRHSSAKLEEQLTRGLNDGGMDVITIGEVPTPMLYYATYALDTGTGVMITGSHNPPEYNGLKMMIGGVTLAEDLIQALLKRLQTANLSDGDGEVEAIDLDDSYVDKILEDVAVAQPLKVVIDCGNGVAGKIAPRLITELGCEVIPLYCEVDGDFPNHHPDPADPANLEDLRTVVKAEKADIGLAFDGDGDRLGVVTQTGEIIWPDKLMMLFAQDIVGRNPGADIIYDVKCSRHLNTLISELGGRPIMWKTGHSHMKAKLKETGALLAGEFSGHLCFGERWYGFDDALYSAARLLEILGSAGRSADEVFAQFPVTFTTPEIKIETSEERKFELMEKIAKEADFGDGTLTTIDGIRVDFADGWGLVRPSNTSPVLTLRFEADGPGALERIQDQFQTQLAAVDSSLTFR